MAETSIDGQLNEQERRILTDAVRNAVPKPKVVLEVGTWLGGGSTLHILNALEENGSGHLWGIEADRSIYERMLENIRTAAPKASARFSPLFGFSQAVIPKWIAQQPVDMQVDLVFLDGGNRPLEQIEEFKLLDPHIPVGGRLMAHDAKLRKGKWLFPYLSQLDNWKTELHDISTEGLLVAKKIAAQPGRDSLKRAQATLIRLRCHPVEILAVVVPSRLRGLVLRLLPAKFSRRLSDGRK
jgi:predicted O-methyltransferase YrrM